MTVQPVWIQRSLVAIVLLVAIVVWRSYLASNDLSTLESGQRFIDAVDAAWWGILAYIGVYLIRPLVLFPASVLTVIGGTLFGPWLGVAVVIVAANISAMIAYGAGRLLGQPGADTGEPIGDDDGAAVDERRSITARWSRRLRTNSFETVLVMRLVFLPYDLVNYVCGVLRIHWPAFLLATALGSLPGTISFVLLGASLERIDQGIDGIDPWAVFASVLIFAVSIVVSRLLRRAYA